MEGHLNQYLPWKIQKFDFLNYLQITFEFVMAKIF